MKAKSYYSFGSSLHKVLERFHDAGDIGVQTVGDALKVYEESWIDAGYSSPEEMQEAFGEGREILELTLEAEQLAREAGTKTVAVEKFFKMDLGKFTLIGRVDRLDQLADGTLDIVDYKSGRSRVTDEDVANDLAMGCYQLLVSNTYPGVPVRATIHALRTNVKASASLTKQELDQLRADLVALGEQIMYTSIEDHAPVRKPLCESCDFLSLCSKNPDF